MCLLCEKQWKLFYWGLSVCITAASLPTFTRAVARATGGGGRIGDFRRFVISRLFRPSFRSRFPRDRLAAHLLLAVAAAGKRIGAQWKADPVVCYFHHCRGTVL